MFCTNCGARLPDGALFCTSCGHRVGQAVSQSPEPAGPASPVPAGPAVPAQPVHARETTAAPAPAPAEPVAQTPTPEPAANDSPAKKKKFPVIPAACAAVVLIGAAAAVFLLPRGGGAEPEDSRPPLEDTLEPSAHNASSDGEDEGEEAPADEPVSSFAQDSEEYRIQQEILRLNAPSFNEASIDVYADNYSPGARDRNATWNNRIFYVLEGYQNDPEYQSKYDCALQKKELRNSATGNMMEYEVCLNPRNNKPNKIVSIEYLPMGLEVTEYYYSNEGKVSFIFQYHTDNYVSTYATPDKTGDRYLFSNDCMVTWRSITADATRNYILGSAEAERMKNQFSASTMLYYDQLDAAGREEFDRKEFRMINAAYNTYHLVMESPGIVRIRGYIYDAYGSGVTDADVALYDSSFSAPLYKTQTAADGMYTIYVPNEQYTYNLRANKAGLSDCDIYAVRVNNEQIGAYQDGAYLFDGSANATNVSLVLGDAFEYASNGNGMRRLSNATVNVRKGINNRAGSVLTSTVCDSNGCALLQLDPGIYTIEVVASGYETMYYTIIANPTRENLYEFYAAPTLPAGEYAIVLTWGATPSDLDSHLFTTSGSSTDHIWFGSQSDPNSSFLDVDDTTSYGPETVTIRRFSADKYYKYCVVDYTNCADGNYSSRNMSLSGARVNVYSSEGLIGTFPVPTNQPGVIWEIFEIRHGVITPIQRYYNTVQNMDWWHNDK